MRAAALTVLAILLFLAIPSGCATAERMGDDPLAAVPGDFSIDLTVLTGAGTPLRTEAHLRPGRFVVFADGSLHYGEEPDRGAHWLPGKVRTLSRGQMAGLWSLVSQLGLADAAAGSPPVNLDLIEPGPDEIVMVLALTGSGDRWMTVRSGTADAPDAAGTRLVRRLAQLAWATEQLMDEASITPPRYDLGDDPYEQYR
jgi:hypothetical protein